MTTPFPFVAGAVLQAQQLNDITNLPINDQTASYVLVVGDAGKRVVMNVASANTVTVDNSVFTTGDTIEIINKGAGTTTVTAGAGVTINSASGLAVPQYQSGKLVALSASSFLFFESDITVSAAGLTLITTSTFSAVASVSVNDCFSSTYNNYRVLVSAASASLTGNQTLAMRMRVGGSDNTANNYNWARFVVFNGGTAGAGATAASFEITGGTAYTNFSIALDVIDPQTTNRTQILGHSLANQNDNLALVGYNGGVMTVTTSYTGFTLFPSSGTFSGEIAVYGYRKA